MLKRKKDLIILLSFEVLIVLCSFALITFNY